MRVILILSLLALLSCREDPNQTTQVPLQEPTATVAAQIINVHHDGHLYVLAFQAHGVAILHSPACYDNYR